MLFFAAVTCAVLERCRVSPRLFAATWTRVDCCAVLAWCVYSFLPTLSAMPFILVRAQQGTQAGHADAGIVLCQSILPSGK
jgi:hypothetical protein